MLFSLAAPSWFHGSPVFRSAICQPRKQFHRHFTFLFSPKPVTRGWWTVLKLTAANSPVVTAGGDYSHLVRKVILIHASIRR
jgi:hypothetical protein